MRTLFFDIDGTLLWTQRAGSDSLSAAVSHLFGLDEVDCDLAFGGRTDRDLVAQLLQKNAIEPSEENQGRVRRRYGLELRARLGATRGDVLPGVFGLLESLAGKAHLNLAVMTGNYPETARMKLEAYELIRFFPWVVGGDLDASRSDMARRAAQQLARRHGEKALDDVIVIGDTANDVVCAKAIGARCLGVCTGSGNRNELQDAGADEIVDDLTDGLAVSFLTA